MPATAVGSLRKVDINGVIMDVKNDANIKETIGENDVEAIVTTGGVVPQYTLRAEMRENFDCVANKAQKMQIKEIADSREAVPCNYQDAAGATWSASCYVVITDADSYSGLIQLKLIPVQGWA